MVDVAQLVELRIVTPAVEGSNPFVHPTFPLVCFSACLYGVWSFRYSARYARVAELVDALDLGSSGATRESSSLSSRTTLSFFSNAPIFVYVGCGAGLKAIFSLAG